MLVFQSSVASPNVALPKLVRDPILTDHNGGVKFLFDAGAPWSMEPVAPVDGKAVRNLTEAPAGNFQLAAGQLAGFAGNGIDLTGLTADPAAVRGPAGCLASIQAEQRFLWVGWYKLPNAANWIVAEKLFSIACASLTNNGYLNGPDLINFMMRKPAGVPNFSSRRQTAGATIQALNLTDMDGFQGAVTMIAGWRTAVQSGLMMRSATAQRQIVDVAGALNTGDFSALPPQWGVVGSNNDLAGQADTRSASAMRVYRGWVEDLALSGRDPAAVLAREWAAVSARGAFS